MFYFAPFKGKPFVRGGRKASGLRVADSGVTENSDVSLLA
jgi:hypothetical protein